MDCLYTHCWECTVCKRETYRTLELDRFRGKCSGQCIVHVFIIFFSVSLSSLSHFPICFSVHRVKGCSMVSGDLSEWPVWPVTSNWMRGWPLRIWLNKRRHVPWSCHHGNRRPLGTGGERGRRLFFILICVNHLLQIDFLRYKTYPPQTWVCV